MRGRFRVIVGIAVFLSGLLFGIAEIASYAFGGRYGADPIHVFVWNEYYFYLHCGQGRTSIGIACRHGLPDGWIREKSFEPEISAIPYAVVEQRAVGMTLVNWRGLFAVVACDPKIRFQSWVRGVVVPAGTFEVVMLVCGVMLLVKPIRTRLRGRKGLCASCGYDVRGNASGVCSECGTAFESKFGKSEPEP